MTEWTTGALWFAVAGSGIYHGVSPGMGWPLAVSAALMDGGGRGFFKSLALLALGHFMAMSVILLPFAALTALIGLQVKIRIAAGALVVCAGIYLLLNRRHPKFLVRIKPSHLVLWSFAIATAHGAGLMLVPIYLGLCGPTDAETGHRAASMLIKMNADTAILVAAVHTLAMLVSGGAIAFAAWKWLGPQFISRSWFNLEIAWALSLVLIGGLGLLSAANGL